MPSIEELTEMTVAFRDARNWEQFHTVKNLIVSLNLEASELLELIHALRHADEA
jgi:NTP pyrophosphatase (non-canonical NTP hydrolase)